MTNQINILLLGELRVEVDGEAVELPPSRKTRALLAFLAATGRPHRRERLCELFWDLADDPKAALRWALTKLRKIVDAEDKPRIIADRERVRFDTEGIRIDLRDLHDGLQQQGEQVELAELEEMVRRLDDIPFDGLDDAGTDHFGFWLTGEREEAHLARIAILRKLAVHPDLDPNEAAKWQRLLCEADPFASPASEEPEVIDTPPRSPTHASERQAALSPEAHALRTQRIGFCKVRDGIKLAYASVGSGPPLLKAANWLTHLEFDWKCPIWGQAFIELSRCRTFIRYDERGCGLSDWDVEDLSFDAFVEDLEVVADALKLDRFPLLGISQGAAVCIEYATRHPERVSALILMSGYAAGWRLHATPEEQERREAVLNLTKVGWGVDNPAYRHIFSQTFMPDAPPEDLAWFDEFQRRTTSPENAARFQDAFGYIDVRHQLGNVRTPTLIFHSKFDQRIPFEHGRALASGIPDAQFVALESANHILVESEPALQVFSEVTRQFLEERGV